MEVTNRFKGLDLIDRLPEELRTAVQTLYRRQSSKPPPPKRNKKGKGLSEEALQIAERKEVKNKGEKERYTHLNAEFQRTARRDEKDFLSE